jgi:hypothetical protein
VSKMSLLLPRTGAHHRQDAFDERACSGASRARDSSSSAPRHYRPAAKRRLDMGTWAPGTAWERISSST